MITPLDYNNCEIVPFGDPVGRLVLSGTNKQADGLFHKPLGIIDPFVIFNLNEWLLVNM